MADFDCIVLGAGIAGVTAARDLQERGQKVLLIEGSDRVGGRMYSRRDLVADPNRPGKFLPVELGAEYVHVRDIDRYREFWRELKRHGFGGVEYAKSSLAAPGKPSRNRVFFPAWGETRSTSKAIEDPEVGPAAPMLFQLEIQDLVDPRRGRDVSARTFAHAQGYRGRGLSIAEYTLSAHTPGLLDDPPPGLPPGAHNPNDDISIDGIQKDEIQDQLLEPFEFKMVLDGGRDPGFDRLPAAIAQEFQQAGGTLLKSSAGQTEMKVVKVETQGRDGVTVTTQGGERFTGRAAICTFSVGMLDPVAGEGDAIFGPLLTADKRAALEVVRMGAITKFGLQFKERKWGHPANDMTVLSNPEGNARTFFSNFPDATDTGPHMLTGLLMSKDHLRIKNLSDEDAVRFLLDEIQKIFDPAGARWTPESVLAGDHDANGNFRPRFFRQDWERDEFARGGNSYLSYHPPDSGKVKATKARAALMDPRATLPLFWAGEATAPAYDRRYQPLAVHGAYRSGQRVAEDVSFWLDEAGGDSARFDRHYRGRYGGRSLAERIADFFRDLFT